MNILVVENVDQKADESIGPGASCTVDLEVASRHAAKWISKREFVVAMLFGVAFNVDCLFS